MMEGRAVVRYIKTSPRKLREVADLVRGKNVNEVLGTLSVLDRRAASVIEKGVKSAVANINEKVRQEKKTVNMDHFFLAEVRVDGGPSLKRYRARAMGRATMIRKRSSHLRIVLREESWDRK